MTQDHGATWTEISQGLPKKWVSRVVASEHDVGTVYLSPGDTWTSIAANLPTESVNVIREDPRHGMCCMSEPISGYTSHSTAAVRGIRSVPTFPPHRCTIWSSTGGTGRSSSALTAGVSLSPTWRQCVSMRAGKRELAAILRSQSTTTSHLSNRRPATRARTAVRILCDNGGDGNRTRVRE